MLGQVSMILMIIFRIAILPLFSSESMSQEIESGFKISQLTSPAVGVQLIRGIGA